MIISYTLVKSNNLRSDISEKVKRTTRFDKKKIQSQYFFEIHLLLMNLFVIYIEYFYILFKKN